MNPLDKYNQLSNKHCLENIKFLIENKINFSIFCELSEVSFSPTLPEEIFSTFRSRVLFVLAGYSFESLALLPTSVEFEAGFGKDNIGSIVNVKVDGIINIIVKDKKDDNFALFSRIQAEEIFPEQKSEKALKSSAAVIFSDPQNQKILKKIQKKQN